MMAARKLQGRFDKSISRARPSRTPRPSKRNQGVKKKATDLRTAMVAKSWSAPEIPKVKMREIGLGRNCFKGEYTNFPKPYPQIGFQYCQKLAKVRAPKERCSIFLREWDAPKGTPFRRKTYSERDRFCLCIGLLG